MKLNQKIPIIAFFFALTTSFLSCKDEYMYDKKAPDFLGASIYDYMEEDGHFTYFLRLINDLNYKDVLSRTGSKTLFPARDEAFERFFEENPYHARSYEALSHAQKREIMNVSMVNMAYLSYMLSNVAGDGENPSIGEGLAVRRVTANSYLDSIPFIKDENLFAANAYWSAHKNRGLYLADNRQSPRIVHFTPENRLTKGITGEDFSVLYNGLSCNENDIYINGIKMRENEKDIICKNGYIHVMEEVLIPAKNMAQIIHDNGETDLFSRLMDKFCMPYYRENISTEAHNYYNGSTPDRPLISVADSIFEKRYFNEADLDTDAAGNTLSNYGLLYYDPTDHAHGNGSEQDMGAMFVPTDQAMNTYFNGEKGRYLKDVYGSWNNVPTDILVLFLKNHQKKSFINSLPHLWNTMTDEASFDMKVAKSDVKKTYMAGNGAVYISGAVFPPADFSCVYASTLINSDTKIMNCAIQNATMKFFYYLRSMENMYNLIVPVDEAFDDYRDPISWAGATNREIWSFRYVPETNRIVARIYRADEQGNKGAFIREQTDQTIITNRLTDILDMHIVVGYKDKDTEIMSGYIDDGRTLYAQTKSGATLKISGGGGDLQMTGGGDLELGVGSARIVNNPQGQKAVYESENGKTFFIDRILQDPVKSVYTLLGEHPEYAAFLALCRGDERVFTYFQTDKDIVPIFDYKRTSGSSGLGYVVNSFNNFRYTVFVPTADALAEAFAADDRLFTWDEIAAENNPEAKKTMTQYLLNFLKFHFMDNSVFINGKPLSGLKYETAARIESGKFHKLTLTGNGNDLNVQGENSSVAARVIKTNGLYNLMARDYIVNSANYMSATRIESSSRAVIHLIDKALKYE